MKPAAPAQLKGVSHVRNVVANWSSFLVAAVAGLFLSPFVVGKLGTSAFGIWVLVGALTSSLNVLDMGVKSTVTRFIAREHARGNHDVSSRIASTARSLFIGTGVVAVAIASLLAAHMMDWFNIPADLAQESRIVMVLGGLTLAVVLSNGLFGGVLSGLQRLDVVGFSEVGVEVLRIVMVVAILSLGGGLVGLSVLMLCLALLRHALQHSFTRRLYPELRLRLLRPSATDVKEIASVSLYSTAIYTSVMLASKANMLILAALMPVSAVTFYAIGTTLPTYAGAINRPIAQTVHPRASRFDTLGDADGLRSMVLDTGRYSSLVMLPMILTFMTRGPTFIEIWMGPDFRAQSGTILQIVSVGLVFAGARHVMQAAFVGSGRHKSLVVPYALEALAIVGLSYVLISAQGLYGAALAVVIPGLLISVLAFPLLARQRLDIPPTSIWWQVWLRPLLAMAPFAVLSILVDRHFDADGYLSFFAEVLALLPVAAAGAYLVGLDGDERGQARAALSRRLRTLFPSAGRRRPLSGDHED